MRNKRVIPVTMGVPSRSGVSTGIDILTSVTVRNAARHYSRLFFPRAAKEFLPNYGIKVQYYRSILTSDE